MLQIRNFLVLAILTLGLGQVAQAQKPALNSGPKLNKVHPALAESIRKIRRVVRQVENGNNNLAVKTTRQIDRRLKPLLADKKIRRSLKTLQNIRADIRNPNLGQLQKENRVRRKAQRFEQRIRSSKLYKKVARPSKRIVLEFGGHQYNGKSPFDLKILAQKKLGLNLANHRLKSVILRAKSLTGRGWAVAIVNRFSTPAQTVPGDYYNFQAEGPATYHRVQFQNLGGTPSGLWRLYLKGTIKVQKIILVTEPISGLGY